MEVTHIKSKTVIGNSFILKPSYHMNYGKKRIEKAIYNEFPFDSLGNVSASVFTGGIFKRMFVDDAKYGYPYISAQHMMNTNPLDVAKIISKKYTPRQEEMSLKESQILVSCAGTVGNVRLITKDLEGVIGSQDIIRVNPDDTKLPYGYLYAYLASKTAYNYMQSYIYGSVVPRIEPNTLSKLPIPILSAEKQQQIHQLIVEASELRVEANRFLEEADSMFHEYNGISYEPYHLFESENLKYSTFKISINTYSKISIKAKNYSKRILEIKSIWNSKVGIKLDQYISKGFRIGPRGAFKRIDSNDIGEEMVSQSDLHTLNPRDYKRVLVSRKSSGDIANKTQVLFPAVGNGSSEGEILFRPTLAYKTFENKLLSGDIGRFDCPSLEHAAYLLIALKSKGGFRMMRAFYYGTQLRRPLWELLKDINIPIKDDNSFKLISEKVIKAYDLLFKGDEFENQAIALIEKEIDLWQVS